MQNKSLHNIYYSSSKLSVVLQKYIVVGLKYFELLLNF